MLSAANYDSTPTNYSQIRIDTFPGSLGYPLQNVNIIDGLSLLVCPQSYELTDPGNNAFNTGNTILITQLSVFTVPLFGVEPTTGYPIKRNSRVLVLNGGIINPLPVVIYRFRRTFTAGLFLW